MCDVANGMRYCPDCRRVVAVFHDHASGDTACTQCARVLDQRYVDKSSDWRTVFNDVGGIDGRGRVGAAASHFLAGTAQPYATTIAYPAPASNAQSPEASDNDATHGAEGAGSVLPRMRGAVGAADHPHPRGGAMPRMSGAVQAYGTKIAYPAPEGNTQSPEASDNDDTHGAEGALPRMRGAVGAAGHPRGGAMPSMSGAVQATATTIAYPAPEGNKQSPEASDNDDTHGAEGASSALPRMRGTVGSAGQQRRGAMPKVRGAVADKSLAEAFHSMDDMAERLGLAAAIKERAREMLRKLEEAKAFPRGGKCRNRNALYAACLHVACRAGGTPRTFKELASVTGDSATAGIKDIGRIAKHIKDNLGEEDGGQAAGDKMMGAVVRAGDFLRRFGSLLGIGDQVVNAALEATRRLETKLDVRRNPDSIAAAVIYMAIQRAGAGKSIRDVSAATGVSELTIREVCYRDLSPHAEMLFG